MNHYRHIRLLLSFLATVPAIAGKVQVSGQAELFQKNCDSVTIELRQESGRSLVRFDYPEPDLLNLSQFRDLATRIRNDGTGRLDVRVFAVSGDSSMAWKHSAEGRFLVEAGTDQTLPVLMLRPPLPKEHPLVSTFGDLHGLPTGYQKHWRHLQVDAIREIRVALNWSGADVGDTVVIQHPFGAGEFSADAELIESVELPLVDVFGQLREGVWPRKIHSASELEEDAETDLPAADQASAAPDRNQFGGWLGGPQLEASGFFRVTKHEGKWWFVDPEGRLFWSLGVNATGKASETRILGRESLFPDLPQDEILFYFENLKKKYGADAWLARHVEVTLARMREWGLNTIGAWSMPELFEPRKVPYTLMVHTSLQKLGSVTKIPDPFSKAFVRSLDENLRKIADDHAGDPWLLGIFVHNELHWEPDLKLAEEILSSPAGTPARKACIAFLRTRYGTIAEINAAWGTGHASWNSISPGTDTASASAYRKDLSDFIEYFAERYFTLCRDAVRRHFPDHLYLGCRFHVFHPTITEVASRFCDVISVNAYRYNVEAFSMSTVEDRPYLISEFHFGIRDYGTWGAGLTPAAGAENQADLFGLYLNDALQHPNFVGAHWFQWSDQPVTGRYDGENFGVGLVSIADRPHPPLIEAIRTTASELYDIRSRVK